MKVTERIFRTLTVLLVVAGVGFTQESERKVTGTNGTATAVQTDGTLPRPQAMKSLKGFVMQKYEGKIDVGSIAETFENGMPALTFRSVNGPVTVATLIVDHGDTLRIYTDSYPTEWLVERSSTEQEDTDANQDVGMTPEPTELPDVLRAVSTPTCAGIASPGNPYPCCSVGSRFGLGNCTFAAWYHMKKFWGVTPGSWGNARTWYDNARAARYPTSTTPHLYSVGVNSTLAIGPCGSTPCGHVAWIMQIIGDFVEVFEQSCGSTASGIRTKRYSIATFNKGFIRNPTNAVRPQITGHSPNLQLWSSRDLQTVRFNVFNVNPGMRAVVTFPNGDRTTLKDAQLRLIQTSSQQALEAYMVLNARGWWKIDVYNETGKNSGHYSFWVN